MAYDLEEQEQIDSFKAFWERWGNLLMTVATVVLLAIAAYRGWGWYQDHRAQQASVAYEQLRTAAEAKDLSKVKAASAAVMDQYAGTVYGPMAALVAARAYAEGNDPASAKTALQWAIDKGSADFQRVARVRLAGLLLDEKQYDDALKALGDAAGNTDGEYADRKGDILLAQGKKDDARAAYREALGKLPATSPLRRLVQLKVDGIDGGGS